MRELSEWFVGAAGKRLSEVEINPVRSNQHEFQATRLVRELLGETEDPRSLEARFLYLTDDAEPLIVDSWITYYDARSGHPDRSAEYRLYYPDNEVTAAARAGDILVFATLHGGAALAAIARSGSTYASQLLWLFDITLDNTMSFVVAEPEALAGDLTPIDADVLLELFGIEVELASTSDLELVTARFGSSFPTTAEFSAFARENTAGADPFEDPDGALHAWWNTEYRLFQAFERTAVEERLQHGFHGDTAVDEFLKFSLSVQNRRKSRSGHAFENHVAAVLTAHKVKFQRGAITERKAKPDFLFPGQAAYENVAFPSEDLRMLAAKTTAKDRWRQVISEADRIPLKHLVTLEPAISKDQTDEMAALSVQLVVPREVQKTYSWEQRDWLWTLADFIADAAN